jgi:two-component system sensor kinase FixL
MAQPLNGGKPTPNLFAKWFSRSEWLLPAATLLLIIVGICLYTLQRRSIAFSEATGTNLSVIEHETGLLTAIDDAETGQRGFLLTGQEEYLKPFYKGAKDATSELAALLQVTNSHAEQRVPTEAVKSLVEKKFSELDFSITQFRGAGREAALAVVNTGEGEQIMDQVRALCQKIRSSENARLVANLVNREQSAQGALLVTAVGGISLTLLLVVALIIIKSGGRERERYIRELDNQAVMLDHANDSIFVRDSEDRITYWNSGAERVYGWTREEAFGQVAHTFLKTQFTRPLDGIRGQLLAEGSWKGELRQTRRDGALIIVASNWTLPSDQSDGASAVVEINLDITARKEAERQARDRAIILDCANDGILIRDAEDHIIYWNQGAQKLYGWSSEEALGQDKQTLFKTQFPQSLDDIRGHLLAEGFWRGELTQTRRDGSLVTVASTWTLQHDDLHGVSSVVEINQDIAERKRYEAELQSKAAEMERFAYTVSHDLKSPLITIKSFVSMIEQDLAVGNLERSRSDLQRVARAAEKMQNLLGEVLALVRVGRVESKPETVSFAVLVDEALQSVAGRIEQNSIRVEVASNLPSVRVDRRRMVEVLQNLIDNAAKFMGSQAAPEIVIGASNDGPETRFFVKDNGIGIEAKYQQKIFGLFDKLDPKSEGSGAGLAIIKRIVDLHGGRIWVESPGRSMGSTFYFTLKELRDRAGREYVDIEHVKKHTAGSIS